MNFYNYSKRVLCAMALTFAFLLPAAAQELEEGWYQIKRTVSLSEVADNPLNFFGSLQPYFLDTNEEMEKSSSSITNKVYGATFYQQSLPVITTETERSDLSTYYYVQPQADGGYYIRTANGHYFKADGTVSVDSNELFLGSPLDVNLQEGVDLNGLISKVGYSVGSKPVDLDLSSLGIDINLTISLSGKWQLIEEESTDGTATNRYLGGKGFEEVLDILKNSNIDWSNLKDNTTELVKTVVKLLGGDAFTFVKKDLNNINEPTFDILGNKKKAVVPYTVSIEGYGDYRLYLTDGLDILGAGYHVTHQNAHIRSISSDINAYSNTTLLYNGATVFVPKEKESLIVHNVTNLFELVAEKYNILLDYSTSQIRVCADNDNKVLHVFMAKPGTAYSKTFDATGYATLNSPFALNIPTPQKAGFLSKQSEVKAYTVSSVDGKTLMMDEVSSVIPAHTPVILYGVYDNKPGGTFKFTVNLDNTDAPVAGNMLEGTCFEYNIPTTVNAYVMKDDPDAPEGVAFQHVGLSNNRTIKEFRAYLHYEGDASGASFTINKNSDATGIENVEQEQEAGFDAAAPIYDLSGRRVAAPAKGIFIQNGKKVIFK